MARSAPAASRLVLVALAGGCFACAAQIGNDVPPRLEFVAPTEDVTVVSGVFEVRLDARPPYLLDTVALKANGTEVRRWTSLPAHTAVMLDTSQLADGQLLLEAEAMLTDGRRLDATRVVGVDNGGPTIEVLSPTPSSVLYLEDGAFPFEVRVSDVSGVAAGTLSVAGEVMESFDPVMQETMRASVDPSSLYPTGTTGPVDVMLTAEFTDRVGQSTTRQVPVAIRSRLRWVFESDGAIETPPTVLPDGGVAIGTLRGRLHVIGANGEERCNSVARDENVLSGPTVLEDGSGIVWGTIQRLRLTSPNDCSTLWTHPTNTQWFGEPAIGNDGTIYATDFDGILHAIAPESGTDRWTADLAAALSGGGTVEGRGHPAVLPDGTVVQGVTIGLTGGAVFAVGTDGSVRWTFEGPGVEHGVVASSNGIYFGGTDGRLYALDFDGGRAWPREPQIGVGVKSGCLPAALPNGDIIACDVAGTVAAFDPLTGDERWSADLRLMSGPSQVQGGGMTIGGNGMAYVGDVLGAVHALGPEGSTRWRFLTPGNTEEFFKARLAASDDTVFAGASDQRLYAVWSSETLETGAGGE